MTKTIFILGQTKEQATEYIKTHIKAVTDECQLRGYTEEQALVVVLPKNDVVKEAKQRGINIIEV